MVKIDKTHLFNVARDGSRVARVSSFIFICLLFLAQLCY